MRPKSWTCSSPGPSRSTGPGPASVAAGLRAGRPAARLLPLGTRLRRRSSPGRGFDLQLGNPPWVRPDTDVDALLAEGDPWWALTLKPSESLAAAKRSETLDLPGIQDFVVESVAETIATREFVSCEQQFPLLVGLRPDLYRCFMQQTWRGISAQGIAGLIHLETHFTDESAGVLREETYLRLRRHWEFINELKLFEIQNQKHYGINIYGVRSNSPEFLTAVSMYHPDTVLRSMSHDGSGSEPGFKDPDGSWDQRPHMNRITTVTDDTLSDWHALLESSEVAVRRSRMVYTVNKSSAIVLGKLTRADRLSSQDLEFYLGLDETLYRRLGVIVHDWGSPSSWQDVILQGPNFFICNPFSKYPNKTMAHHRDYSAVDLETLLPDSIPATAYKPGKDRIAFDRANPRVRDDQADATRNYYRVMWRSMAALTGERTLISIIVPPGCSNLKQNSYGFASIVGGLSVLTLCAGSMASLVLDFMTRVAPKSSIPRSVIAQLPVAALPNSLATGLSLRTLRLNCLSEAYAELWHRVTGERELHDGWTGGLEFRGRRQLDDVTAVWTARPPSDARPTAARPWSKSTPWSR